MAKRKKKKSKKLSGKCSPVSGGKRSIRFRGGKRGKKRKIAKRAWKSALLLFNKKRKKTHFTRLKGRGKMARKRKHSKRRFHGFGGRRSGQHSDIIVMGKKRRSHRRRSRGLLMGDPGLIGDVGGNLVNVAAGLAGGVVGSYVTNMVPVANLQIRAMIPLLGGVVIASISRMPVLKMAGLGLGIVGGLSLVKHIMPGVNLLGEDPQMWIPAADRMGIEDQSNLGEVVEMAGEDSIGYASQADM